MNGLLDLIALRLAGKPLEALSWQELLAVRDEIDEALNGELNRRQGAPVLADRGGAS